MEKKREINNIGSNNPVLYTVCYSHLDTQWRWDYKVTIREYILNTLRDNFKLFEKYPHYTFNFSGSNRYRMMKEYYPAEYEQLKKYVTLGRFIPCGSSVDENDALIPSTESIIRQILYGNDFFQKEFGKISEDYMLPDCFGFPASLPCILVHCGIKGFSTQKLTWGSAVGIPFNIGLWEATDGESVISVFNPGDYITQVKEDLSRSSKWLERISDIGKNTGLFKEYMYAGTGDWGGAPAEESIKWIEKSIDSDGPIHVLSSPADRFFKDITGDEKINLPRYKGELLLTNHSAGSLTSQAYMKRWNRKNELLAYSAETSSVIGEWLGGITYPKDKLNEAWRLVLGTQFHDILAGTCIPKAYEYSWNDEILALNQFSNVLSDAVGSVTRAMDTRAKGIPLIVFNPLAIEREDIVQATITFPESIAKYIKVFNRENIEIPSQIINIKDKEATILFPAKVPSVGFVIFDICQSDTPCSIETGLKITNSSLENSRYILKVNSNGDVSSIYDKSTNREILQEPVRLAFLEEHPKECPAWNMDWRDRKNPSTGYVNGAALIKVVESGPVRIALEIDRESRGSRFIQRICLSVGGSSNRVEFDTKIDWFTKESSLKATFPLKVSNSLATYNVGLGTIQRGNNDPKKFEVPSHQWFDLTDKSGDYGVSIIEDSKFGSDKPNDNELRLTLLYTPGVRNDFKDQATQDFGRHEILYAIYGHKGDWRESNTNWEAARLNQPLVPFQTIPHKGLLGKSFSFVKINNNDISISAVKKAENSDEIIIRIQETKGKPATGVEITLPAQIISVREVNGQEHFLKAAMIKDEKIIFEISPYHLRTFALILSKPLEELSLPISEPIELPNDVNAISYDENKAAADFDGTGLSFPAELSPDRIISEGIIFKIGSRGENKKNALICKGQIINLPEGNFNRLYILAASTDDDVKDMLKVDGKPYEITVQKWTGFIGSWDNRIWDGYIDLNKPDYYWGGIDYIGLKPGYIKRDNVAYFTTHRHLKTGENDPYCFCYLFKYKIDIEPNSKKIILPMNEKIRIFSITAAYNENDETKPAQFLYDNLDSDINQYERFQVCRKPGILADSYIIGQDRPQTVEIITKEPGSEIRYSLDGSEPDNNSPIYTRPIQVEEAMVIKAVTFKSGKQPSEITSVSFYKAYCIKDIKYLTDFSQKYKGRSEKTLIDSIRAGISSLDKGWLGYEEDDLEVILDLGEVKLLHRVTIGCLNNNASWIFLPTYLEVRVSDNPGIFILAASADYDIPKKDEGLFIKDLSLQLKNIKARYLHVKAKNIGKCPDWHSGAGGKAWLFADQILVE